MKKLIIAFILGGIVFGSIGIYAANYLATDITYTPIDSSWDVSNVNDAINSLYDNVTELKSLGNATEGDIAEGKTAVVQGKLVTGTMSESKVVHGTKSGTVSGGEEINVGYKPQYIYLKFGASTGTNTYYTIYLYFIPAYSDSVCMTTRTNSTIGSSNTTISYVDKEVDISTYFTLTDTGFIASNYVDSYTYTIVY